MRQCLFFLLLVGLSSQVMAQKPYYAPQSHEVQAFLFNAHTNPSISNSIDGTVAFTPLSGLRYMYHIDLENGVGLEFGRRNTDLIFSNDLTELSAYSGEKKDLDFKLVYERKYHVYTWMIAGQAKVIYNSGSITDQGTFTNNTDFSGSYDYTNWGASIGGKLAYFFSKNLSLSAEVDAYFLQTSHELAPESRYLLFPENEWGIQTRLGVSYHFVKMPKKCACPKVRR
ncbi:MAG: hypothetical protein AAFR66_19365 [Bacteroidota bacterium]